MIHYAKGTFEYLVDTKRNLLVVLVRYVGGRYYRMEVRIDFNLQEIVLKCQASAFVTRRLCHIVPFMCAFACWQ